MKKSTKILLIIGGSLMGLGIVCFVIAGASVGFDFSSMYEKTEYEKRMVEYDGTIDTLQLCSISDNIKLLPSEDKKTRLEYYESKDEKVGYVVDREKSSSNEKGKLMVHQENNYEWYENIFRFDFSSFTEDRSLTVYLPADEYDSIILETISGDISLKKDMELKSEFKINDTSGNITVENVKHGGNTKIYCVSGNVSLKNTVSKLYVDVSSIRGSILFDKADAGKRLDIKSTSGNIKIKNVSSDESFLETVSGNIDVSKFDTKNLKAKTISGDVEGCLGYDGVFSTSTVSGEIRVPSAVDASRKYSFETISGNIELR